MQSSARDLIDNQKLEDEDELVFDGIEKVRPIRRAVTAQRALDVHSL
jgi:hypothetical protein